MKEQELLDKNGKLSFWNFIKWSFKFSWKEKKARIVLLAFVIYFGIGLTTTIMFWSVQTLGLLLFKGFGKIIWSSFFSIIFPFISISVSCALVVGILGLLFSILKRESYNIGTMFKSITWKKLWSTLLGVLLFVLVYGVAIVLMIGLLALSMILFHLPVVAFLILFVFASVVCFFVVRFRFFTFAIIEKSMNPIEGFEYSWNITKGHFREIIGISLFFACVLLIPYLLLLLFIAFQSMVLLILIPILFVLACIFMLPIMALASAKYYLLISESYESAKNIGLKKKVVRKKK